MSASVGGSLTKGVSSVAFENLGLGPSAYRPSASITPNYVHPAVFVLPFLPLIAWRWRRLDPRLKVMCLTLTPLLLLSNLCFGWMYESRNYMPLVPLLATAALPDRRDPGASAKGAGQSR